MKGGFWKKITRKGYNASGGGFAARYNGKSAKTDKRNTRSRIKRLMTKIFFNQDDE